MFLRLLFFAFIVMTSAASAADCPRKGTLGTSRVLAVDAKAFPNLGLKSFPQTLPLADKEVVLTFDDGPFLRTTNRILAALAAECVHATFFLIGKSAQANPDIVKKIAAAGHSIGHHTWSHPILSRLDRAAAIKQIDNGIEADERALHDGAAKQDDRTLFFRFPGFASTPALLDDLKSRHIAVFGADLWASDWNVMRPQQELRLIAQRLESAGKGIILLHDTKAQTAAMLPAFLQYLRKNGYKIVHVVPAQTKSSSADDK
ncbi:MAG: polysaccharide deacetylase family protein [Pseudomonadota bacterium]